MTATFSFRTTASSAASPHALFEKIADGGNWARWLKPLVAHSEWETEGDPAPGGVGAVRKVGTWPIFVRERVLEHEPDRKHVYTLVGRTPARDYRAEVTLVPRADGGTELEWRGRFTERVPGTGLVVRFVLYRAVRLVCARLVRAAEGY
ncbi:MAG: SRPBCC family protein [Sciscionella sp.]